MSNSNVPFELLQLIMLILRTYSSLIVLSPPTDVQLRLKFVNGDVSITATWMVSSNAHTHEWLYNYIHNYDNSYHIFHQYVICNQHAVATQLRTSIS